MNILLFGGTSDSHALARRLADLPVDMTVSVATGHGEETLADLCGRFTIHAARMGEEEILGFIRRNNHDLIIDATHPYATEVSKNACSAASRAAVPYFRLARPAAAVADGCDCRHVSSASEAANSCNSLGGNVLIATGSKELAAFTAVSGFTERVFVRVLPLAESIQSCTGLGVRSGNIIAMQGPFSRELNVAIMRQFAIRILVTKDGGAAGGTEEKLTAAREVGATVVMIDRPAEQNGHDIEAIIRMIRDKLEAGL